MPFTIGLRDDRGRNGLAPCAPMIHNGFWDSQPWEVRKEYCRTCYYRFLHQPTCNMDFMKVGDTEPFKAQVQRALGWIASEDPDWTVLESALYEADFAYYYIGLETPRPRQVISAFMGTCAKIQPDEQFWKAWNYRGGEQHGGRMVSWGVTDAMKKDVTTIVLNVTEPQTYVSKRLLHLYAAAAVFWEIGKILEEEGRAMDVLIEVCANLVEACRRAVMANSSLEIS